MDPREVKLTRCDRCGAEAKVRYSYEALELLFCGHHNDKHTEKLVATGFTLEVLVKETVDA